MEYPICIFLPSNVFLTELPLAHYCKFPLAPLIGKDLKDTFYLELLDYPGS